MELQENMVIYRCLVMTLLSVHTQRHRRISANGTLKYVKPMLPPAFVWREVAWSTAFQKTKRNFEDKEHKGSAIGNHLREQHNMAPNDIARRFKILRKCQNKLDCLIFEMLFIKELKPSLNKQCDSIRAKLFL